VAAFDRQGAWQLAGLPRLPGVGSTLPCEEEEEEDAAAAVRPVLAVAAAATVEETLDADAAVGVAVDGAAWAAAAAGPAADEGEVTVVVGAPVAPDGAAWLPRAEAATAAADHECWMTMNM